MPEECRVNRLHGQLFCVRRLPCNGRPEAVSVGSKSGTTCTAITRVGMSLDKSDLFQTIELGYEGCLVHSESSTQFDLGESVRLVERTQKNVVAEGQAVSFRLSSDGGM